MKKLLYLFGTFLLLSSCEPKFNPNAEFKAIDVVYGTLDPDAPKQYFEIGRGFQNQNGSALDFAKVNDSIYHQDSMLVELIELNNNGSAITSVSMRRELFTNREEGDFVNPEHYLYTFDSTEYKVKEGTEYRLRVRNSKTGKTSISEIKSVNDFFFDPTSVSQGVVNLFLIKKEEVVDDEYFIEANGNNDVVYRMDYYFGYVTLSKDNDTLSRDTLVFNVVRRKNAQGGNQETKIVLDGQSLMSTILNEIPPVTDPSHKRRLLPLVNYFEVSAYGPEMVDYLEAEDNFNAISQTKPFYTNISDEDTGESQSGLFTSKKTIRQLVNFSNVNLQYISSVKPELGFPQ